MTQSSEDRDEVTGTERHRSPSGESAFLFGDKREGANSSASSGTAGDGIGREEKVLAQYEQLREEVRSIGESQWTAILRGIGVIGVLVGYAFYTRDSGGFALFVLVPFAIGILVVYEVMAAQWILRLEYHIIRLQQELGIRDVSWENQYGVLSETMPYGVTLSIGILGVILLMVYVGSIFIALNVLSSIRLPVQLGVPVTESGLLAVYVVFTGFVIISFVAYLWARSAYRDQLSE